MKKSFFIILCSCLILTGCGTNNESKEESSLVNESSESTDTKSESSNVENSESETEEATEVHTISEEKEAELLASHKEYLENIEVYLLDFYNSSIEDAHLEYNLYTSFPNLDTYTESTIVTIGLFTDSRLQWLDYIDIIDNNNETIPNTFYSTNWSTEDDEGNEWTIMRFRLAGNYDKDDLKIRLKYDGHDNLLVDRDLSNENTFEHFSDNMYWHEDISDYGANADEAADYNPIKHKYIHKINGVYCFVDEVFGNTSGTTTINDQEFDFHNREFEIIPLQGPLGPILSADQVDIVTDNTKPFLSIIYNDYKEYTLGDYIDVNLCCSQEYLENWDNMTNEERLYQENVDKLYSKCLRDIARNSYLVLPDGEGGTVKIECAEK